MSKLEVTSDSSWQQANRFLRPLTSLGRWLLKEAHWERLTLSAVFAGVLVLCFYNLGQSPRPWQDEGGTMLVAKSLAETGVYAVNSAEGYQTYGTVQSTGPTIIVPIALGFKLLGVGLWQGRLIVAAYLLFTLTVFYSVGRELFGRGTALLALVLLLGSRTAPILWYGREALGDVPALGLFLAGWLVWLIGMRKNQAVWYFVVSGLLIGAAMVSKGQYSLMGIGAIAGAAILNWIYYRQRGGFRSLVIVTIVASLCLAAWWAWQIFYYGQNTFQENAGKLSQLASATYGFHLAWVVDALKFFIKPELGSFYQYWGIPALLYASWLAAKRSSKDSYRLAPFLIFTLVWFAYYIFWTLPWPQIAFAPATITALFVAKLWADGLRALTELRRFASTADSRKASVILAVAVVVAILITLGHSVIGTVRSSVLTGDSGPQQAADFIQNSIGRSAVIDTWERELGVFSSRSFHYPDQAYLAQTLENAYWQVAPTRYLLGEDYFRRQASDYVVVGWFARLHGLYDPIFLEKQACLVATLGSGDLRYEVYKLWASPSMNCYS
jgi:4-amino-4-deoxy-L-arabinose transferase-like glycosyltransferase